MSNGHVCCILGVCCPPAKQESALAEFLGKRIDTSIPWSAEHWATLILDNFDLAPKGTTQAVLDGWGAGAELRAAAIGDRIVDLYAASFAEKEGA